MPRPRKLDREPYTATMHRPLLQKLDALAEETGRTRSQVIEEAIQIHLSIPGRMKKPARRRAKLSAISIPLAP